jgi:hypothetical protein
MEELRNMKNKIVEIGTCFMIIILFSGTLYVLPVGGQPALVNERGTELVYLHNYAYCQGNHDVFYIREWDDVIETGDYSASLEVNFGYPGSGRKFEGIYHDIVELIPINGGNPIVFIDTGHVYFEIYEGSLPTVFVHSPMINVPKGRYNIHIVETLYDMASFDWNGAQWVWDGITYFSKTIDETFPIRCFTSDQMNLIGNLNEQSLSNILTLNTDQTGILFTNGQNTIDIYDIINDN